MKQRDSLWLELAVKTERASETQQKLMRLVISLLVIALAFFNPCLLIGLFRSKHFAESIRTSNYRTENLYRAEYLADLFALVWTSRLKGTVSFDYLEDPPWARHVQQDEHEMGTGKYHPSWLNRRRFLASSIDLVRLGQANTFLESWDDLTATPQRPWWHWVIGICMIPCLTGVVWAPLLVLMSALSGAKDVLWIALGAALLGLIPCVWFMRDVAALLLRFRIMRRFCQESIPKSTPEIESCAACRATKTWAGLTWVAVFGVGALAALGVAVFQFPSDRELTDSERQLIQINLSNVRVYRRNLLRTFYEGDLLVYNAGNLVINELHVVCRRNSPKAKDTDTLYVKDLRTESVPYEGALLPQDTCTIHIDFAFNTRSSESEISVNLEGARTQDDGPFRPSDIEEFPNFYRSLITASDSDQVKLVANHPKALRRKAPNGLTGIHAVFATCKLPAINKLYQMGYGMLVTSDDGSTILHMAAVNPNPGVVEYAARLSPVNGESREGETALMRAAKTDHAANCSWLLAHGADPNLCRKDGMRPIELAILNNLGNIAAVLLRSGKVPRNDADPNGNCLMVQAFRRPSVIPILLASGLPIDQSNSKTGTTILMLAAEKHDILAQWLMEHGANPWKRDNTGRTAFDYAATAGFEENFDQMCKAAGLKGVVERNSK